VKVRHDILKCFVYDINILYSDQWWVGITDEDIEDEWKWYGTDEIAEFNGEIF